MNTGEVVAGDPSDGQTLVTGDTVNTAARLEQAAQPGEILLGEQTYRLVRDAVVESPVSPSRPRARLCPCPPTAWFRDRRCRGHTLDGWTHPWSVGGASSSS